MGTDADVNVALVCAMLSRKYLAASVVGFADYFKNDLGLKYKKRLDPIRALTYKGF